MSYTPRTSDAERELAQKLHRHYALRVRSRLAPYMERPGQADKHVATRSSTDGALGLIRQRRDAAAETDTIVRRECNAKMREVLNA